MRWNVHKVENRKIGPVIGVVQAPHHPAAALRAIKKFKITSNAEQMKLSIWPTANDPYAKQF